MIVDTTNFHCRKIKVENLQVGDIFSFSSHLKKCSPSSVCTNYKELRKIICINGYDIQFIYLDYESSIMETNVFLMKSCGDYVYVYNRDKKVVK